MIMCIYIYTCVSPCSFSHSISLKLVDVIHHHPFLLFIVAPIQTEKDSPLFIYIYIYISLWLCNIAMETDPYMDVSPIFTY